MSLEVEVDQIESALAVIQVDYPFAYTQSFATMKEQLNNFKLTLKEHPFLGTKVIVSSDVPVGHIIMSADDDRGNLRKLVIRNVK